jgi:hypothetical protein
MKKQLPKLKNFLQLVALLSVFGVFSIAQAQVVVDMRVSSSEDKLEVTTQGKCKGPNNRKGCVSASGRILINFLLKGDTQCSSGGQWALDKVVLSEGKDSGPGISHVAATDFDANESTGVVTPKIKKPKHIQIRDHNTDEYDIWYTVYANCAAGDSTISTDPRIRNDGSG